MHEIIFLQKHKIQWSGRRGQKAVQGDRGSEDAHPVHAREAQPAERPSPGVERYLQEG